MFGPTKQPASKHDRANVFAFLTAFLFLASASFGQSPGTFSATGSMTTARSEHSATLLLDGRVFLTGGRVFVPGEFGSGSLLASAELYDPSTGAFTAAGNMTTPRVFHTSTVLPDGRVLIAGGYDAENSALSSAELYDPSSGTFTPTGGMIGARAGHAAILLASGKVLMLGGYWTSSQSVADAELYDPATGTFGATGEYVIEGACDAGAPAVPLDDGTVLFAQEDLSQVYNPITGAFQTTGGPSDCLSAAAPLANGKVLFAGGESESEIDSTHAKLYDPSTGAFASTGNMAWHRFEHTLTPLPDGTALAAGGEYGICTANTCMFAGTLSNAELYDPSAGAFAPTGDMTARRETHTATLLKDGRVLMAGGLSYGGINLFFGTTASAELYCPVSVNCPPDSWQRAINAMTAAAGTDSYNFWQWAWFWQTTAAFPGAPSGFGVSGSISPVVMQQIVAAGGGDPTLNVSAEQWVSCFRKVFP